MEVEGSLHRNRHGPQRPTSYALASHPRARTLARQKPSTHTLTAPSMRPHRAHAHTRARAPSQRHPCALTACIHTPQHACPHSAIRAPSLHAYTHHSMHALTAPSVRPHCMHTRTTACMPSQRHPCALTACIYAPQHACPHSAIRAPSLHAYTHHSMHALTAPPTRPRWPPPHLRAGVLLLAAKLTQKAAQGAAPSARWSWQAIHLGAHMRSAATLPFGADSPAACSGGAAIGSVMVHHNATGGCITMPQVAVMVHHNATGGSHGASQCHRWEAEVLPARRLPCTCQHMTCLENEVERVDSTAAGREAEMNRCVLVECTCVCACMHECVRVYVCAGARVHAC